MSAPTGDLPRRLAAEAVGTAFLLMAIVGSGIMAAKLAGGNVAIALLGNSLSTGSTLAILILVFEPISGAHFNPVVSLAFAMRGQLSWSEFAAYVIVQVVSAVLGVWAAHLMFELPIWQISTNIRAGPGQWFAEVVATFGLVATILACSTRSPAAVPFAVGLYIAGAFWFTASTSFANPAVTVARALSDTFAGIAPGGIAGFIAAQIVGGILAALTLPWLLALPESRKGA